MTTPHDLVRRKAALRAAAVKRRAGIPGSYGRQAADAVAARLVDELPIAAGAAVAGYWPLAGELDPRPAMARLRA